MLVTSSKANKMLKEYNEKLAELRDIEDKSSVFLVSVGENPETIRPRYNFIESQREIAKIEEKIVKLKHAINVFNINTKLEGIDMTIDQALVVLPQLTKDKERLEKMATRIPKQRFKEQYSSSNIVEYEYTNYDIGQAKAELDNVRAQLYEIQIALNKINTSKEFEV